ncbi:MAG: hypothetical protein WCV83_01695 [Candidatus Magasanikbacteria bacterium]|jgi:hypothetical protein
MKKEDVINLSRELFKIRISSSNEGLSQNDGTHKLTVEGITFYNHETIEKWYKEAIGTAEVIIGIEEEYLKII